MKYIYENKINNAIVIEDDAVIDFSRLNELDDVKGFAYIGGRFQSPILKNDNVFQKEFNKEIFSTKKIHTINPEEFIIIGAHGLYFEQVAHNEARVRIGHVKQVLAIRFGWIETVCVHHAWRAISEGDFQIAIVFDLRLEAIFEAKRWRHEAPAATLSDGVSIQDQFLERFVEFQGTRD